MFWLFACTLQTTLKVCVCASSQNNKIIYTHEDTCGGYGIYEQNLICWFRINDSVLAFMTGG